MLRNQWGFKGYVQSDFGATHSTALSLNAGEDFEMQSGTFYSTTRINAALADGSLAIGTIDRALTRRYVQMFKFGIFDRPITHTPIDAATAQAHGAVARSIGEQIAVLLKNNGNILPLNASQIHSIALIGQPTFANAAAAGGGGSSRVAADLHRDAAARAAERPDARLARRQRSTWSSWPTTTAISLPRFRRPRPPTSRSSWPAWSLPKGAIGPNLSLPNNQDALISAIAACQAER